MRRWRPGPGIDELRSAVTRGIPLLIPTESSYGLGVDPRQEGAVERVYLLKERERGKPLPVVAADRRQLEQLGIDLRAPGLARWIRHWPAPLTLVLPCLPGLAASAGTGTLAVRIPDHPGLRVLLREIGCPLTATSANPSGSSPVLDPEEAARWLADEEVILVDDGPLPGGAPSTVVRPRSDGTGETLRPGSWRES